MWLYCFVANEIWCFRCNLVKCLLRTFVFIHIFRCVCVSVYKLHKGKWCQINWCNYNLKLEHTHSPLYRSSIENWIERYQHHIRAHMYLVRGIETSLIVLASWLTCRIVKTDIPAYNRIQIFTQIYTWIHGCATKKNKIHINI